MTSARRLSCDELRTFIEANRLNIHSMDSSRFKAWLQERIEAAGGNELFQLRCTIRDINRAHRRRLRDRKRRLEEAQRLYRASPNAQAYERATAEVESLSKAVNGLSQAVAQGRADPDKLASFQARHQEALRQKESLLNEVGEKKRLDRAIESLERVRDEIGLTAAEAKLEQAGQRSGTASTVSGKRFETVADEATRALLLPTLASTPETLFVLHGVTLGCPRGELDQVIIAEQTERTSVDALAVVEAKRNINDLAHGFRMRQENLAWFSGAESGYDLEQYRTDRFSDGRFSAPMKHTEGDRDYVFDARSFAGFAEPTDGPHRLRHLYFVTEMRPLMGMTAGEMSRILYRVSTDPKFNIDSPTFMKRFFEWARGVVDPFQTRDVLQLYADSATAVGHIVFAK